MRGLMIGLAGLALLAAASVGALAGSSALTAAAGGVLMLSEGGFQAIRNWEGFRAHLYNDSAGHCTIGFGHLVHKGRCNGREPQEFRDGITRERAEEFLRQDVRKAERAVNARVRAQLTQSQFDALASFVFNVGDGNFKGSTLLRVLNAGNYAEVPRQLSRWIYSSGKKTRGLIRRRAAEGRRFASAGAQVPPAPPPPPSGSARCFDFEVEFGQRIVRRADGTFELGAHILKGCWPRTVTLTIVNETPANLAITGSVPSLGRVSPEIFCGGSELTRGSGNACSLTVGVEDPRFNLAAAFYPPRVVLRAVVAFPPTGPRRVLYEVEWKTIKGGVVPCGGNVYGEFCDVYLGKLGSMDSQNPKLADPRSVTLRVRARIVG